MSSHHHKEQRQVGASACPVTIQVDPQAHLVAIFTGIKGWKTQIKYYHFRYSLLIRHTGFIVWIISHMLVIMCSCYLERT